MATKNLRYKGHRIGVVNIHNRDHLFIEGEHIPATAAKKAGPFISPHLPYQSFPTLQDLGKAVVEYRGMDKRGRKKSTQS
jgi:hypothetical protein